MIILKQGYGTQRAPEFRPPEVPEEKKRKGRGTANPEADDLIRKYWNSGMSLDCLGQLCWMARSNVSKRARLLGLPPKRRSSPRRPRL